jgi:adenosylmethionine-8-amino-7-oxononanoate transaminase
MKSFLKDIYGRWYVDGVSSIWVNVFGHKKKAIDNAIKRQLGKIAHSTLLGLSNAPAINLAEKLVQIVQKSLHKSDIQNLKSEFQNSNAKIKKENSKRKTYNLKPLSKVFYSDNGSTAVEVALKMAFQYWKHQGVKGKDTFISLSNAYHGDTVGAVSVGGIDMFHEAFGPLLFKTYRAPSPYCYRCELGRQYPDCNIACLKKMERILKAHAHKIAALIIEPLMQGAGGMIASPTGYLKGTRDLCNKYNILMIADEVATGFGKTGKMFACEHEEVVPDFLCLSKGITGGYMPLAATLTTEEVYSAFLAEFKGLKTFFHGHSYTGNPLACAAALACLDLFEKERILEYLTGKIVFLEAWLKDILNLRHVGDVRNAGLMAGVELVRNKKTKEPYEWVEKMGWRVALHARDKGVIIRPLGNVVVIMPPLSISEQNLKQLLKVIKQSIIAVTKGKNNYPEGLQ